jgi:hypothetical protein
LRLGKFYIELAITTKPTVFHHGLDQENEQGIKFSDMVAVVATREAERHAWLDRKDFACQSE